MPRKRKQTQLNKDEAKRVDGDSSLTQAASERRAHGYEHSPLDAVTDTAALHEIQQDVLKAQQELMKARAECEKVKLRVEKLLCEEVQLQKSVDALKLHEEYVRDLCQNILGRNWQEGRELQQRQRQVTRIEEGLGRIDAQLTIREQAVVGSEVLIAVMMAEMMAELKARMQRLKAMQQG